MKKFDSYEVARVRQYRNPTTGEQFCEPVMSTATNPDGKMVAEFWTLYGHVAGEGVIAIGDFTSLDSACEILSLILGRTIKGGAAEFWITEKA